MDHHDNSIEPAEGPETRRVVLGFQDAQDLNDLAEAPDLPTEPLPLNMGPSHPATHGVLRLLDPHDHPPCLRWR